MFLKSDNLALNPLNIDRAVAASLMNPKLLPAALISNQFNTANDSRNDGFF